MSLTFKGFTLDPFQEKAIKAIDKGNSVVVSAATGTGKTLIADYVIEQAIKEGFEVIYTAPIKALSNQKFRDFKEAYGDKVGLLTGDVVINPEAPIKIMTTEIYRNMLVDKERFEHLKYVVFDEIHFINDPERGTVWEESLIFSPSHVRFVCLSATIPNYEQFAHWIESIQDHTVETIYYGKRAVPLTHQVYDAQLGITSPEELAEAIEEFPQYNGMHGKKKKRNRLEKKRTPMADHRDLVRDLKQRDLLPAIFFVFSRVGTFTKAEECARKFQFTDAKERQFIIEYFNKNIKPEIKHMESVKQIKWLLVRGVGVHNAGMLPNLKEIVEQLFGKGLIKVLYATETFAVGINMPARTVCFNSLEKFDGRNFRYLNTKEYFQLAGRAGRRGIDKVGHSITIINRERVEMDKVLKVLDKDIEPIESQFKLSYNMVLNLMKNYDEETRKTILKSNFGYFVQKEQDQLMRIMTSFSHHVRRLTLLEYIKDNQVTWRGEFATRIYTKEIPITELVYDEIFEDLTDQELVLTLMTLLYEGKPSDRFMMKGVRVDKLVRKLSKNKELGKAVNIMKLKRLYTIVDIWFNGGDFEDLLDVCSLVEGDLIRMFRQTLDMMSQMKHALIISKHFPDLIDRITRCSMKIDRDLMAVEF